MICESCDVNLFFGDFCWFIKMITCYKHCQSLPRQCAGAADACVTLARRLTFSAQRCSSAAGKTPKLKVFINFTNSTAKKTTNQGVYSRLIKSTLPQQSQPREHQLLRELSENGSNGRKCHNVKNDPIDAPCKVDKNESSSITKKVKLKMKM